MTYACDFRIVWVLSSIMILVLVAIVVGVGLLAGGWFMSWKWPKTLAQVIRQVVKEETADLRKQMYPNGGSSLADKINLMKDDVTVIRDGLMDVRTRLEAMHPTGEVPVTK